MAGAIVKKIWPKFFNDIIKRQKRFEIRKDEDKVKVGDVLILKEWDPETKEYTGRELTCRVEYVFRGDKYKEDFGLKPGYCIIGFWVLPFTQGGKK